METFEKEKINAQIRMDGHYSAPRDDDNSGGITVTDAINKWCSDHNGERIDWLVSKYIADRFSINNFKVSD